MVKPDDAGADPAVGPNGKPIPTMGNRPGQGPKTVTVKGVKFTVHADGSIDLPGGIGLPKGSHWDTKGFIQSADHRQVYKLRDGKVVVTETVKVPTGSRNASGTFVPSGGHTTETRDRVLYDSNATPTGGARPAADHALVSAGPSTTTPQPRKAAPAAAPASRSRPASPTTPAAASTSDASGSGDVYDAIKRAAAENGVPLVLALAIAQHESGFDAGNTTGDNGHSWGLYQLYDQGEGAGMGNRRLDPYTNASTALKVVGQVLKQNPNQSWGWVAAHAQRPADFADYTNTINSIVTRAHSDPNYFAGQLQGATLSSSDVTGAGTGAGGRIPGASAPTGTGPGGAITAADSTPQLPPNASPAAIQQFVEQYYPEVTPYLHDHEVGPILLQAAQGGWSDDRLRGALEKTQFWKTHSASTRAWDLLNQTDNATAKTAVGNTIAAITQMIQQTGQHLSPLQIHDLAVKYNRFGWDQNMLRSQVGALSKVAVGPDGKPTGQAAVTLDGLKQQASQYMVPVSDVTLQTWVNQIVNGQVPPAAFESYLKEQAKSMFPGMSVAIDSGVTPAQYTDPYKQLAAQTLELPPDQINFSDPKWSKALFQVDPKTGARTSMSLADWGKTLRSDPIYGYGKTQGAQSQAADFTENILQTFGAVGNYGGNG